MNTDFDFENPDDDELPIPSSSKKIALSKRIALSSVCAALASVMIVLTNIAPFFTFFPLMIAAFCFFLAFEKAGIVYGFISIIVSVLISAFIWPLSLTFFLTVFIFAPYSFAAFLLRKFHYTKMKLMLIRFGIMTIFANIVFLLTYLITITFAIAVIGDGGINLENIFNLHYALLAVIFTVLFLLFDILFVQANLQISKRIKI